MKIKKKQDLQVKLKSKDLGDGEIEVVVASGALDRHGEKIKMDGLDTRKYMKNPVVQWAHDYSLPPIGKTLKLWSEGNKLMARMKFAIAEYPFAKTIYDLVKGGFLNAASIGFIADWDSIEGNMITKSEMVEFSIVPVPANPEALISARKLGIDTDFLTKYDNAMKYKLVEVVEKEVKDLTVGEIAFLKENIDNMTKAQISKFSSVLKEVEEEEEEETETETPVAPVTPATPVADEELKDEVKSLKAEVEKLKSADPIIIKNINQGAKITSSDEASKELKLLAYVQGLKSGNFEKYLQIRGKDAMNTADDSVVLPPQEFVTEIIRLEEEVGVAARYATVRRSTSGAGIKYLLGDDDVEIFDTAESGVKKSTKLSYTEQLLAWRKFAAILPITDELSEDAAIDLWNDATRRFARAFAKRGDQLVFTEVAAGGVTKNGIVNVAGTNIVSVASLAALTFEDFVDMIFGVPSASGNSGRFFLNRSMVGVAMKLKDSENRPLWLPAISADAPATILGRPYTEVDVMQDADTADAGDAVAVYGDLKYATLGERTQLNIKIFDTGLVGDPDDEDQSDQINLMTQDAQAMRVVKRMNAIVRFPAAFSVLKIAAGS